MTPPEIHRFFRTLAKETPLTVTVILTGAAAGSLMGSVRPSLDIDFAVRLPSSARHRSDAWTLVEEAIRRTAQQTGIAANFSSDIDRWSSISLLDWAHHTRRYKRFGRVEVRILAPAYWAIGKLARYIKTDSDDLVGVFKASRVSVASLLRTWGLALKESPPSTACLQFRRHIEHFLRSKGRSIWGRSFDLPKAIQGFHQAAGIRL